MEKKNAFRLSESKVPVKLFIAILMAFLLLIPVQMIESLILEREELYQEAVRNTSADWGENQVIAGPFLIVPIKTEALRNTITYFYENGERKSKYQSADLVITPKKLKLKSKVYPNYKHRGIYKFVVYNSEMEIEADFSNFDLSEIRINNSQLAFSDLDWEKARLQLEISDAKGISGASKILWNNKSQDIKPINTSQNSGKEGFYCNVNVDSISLNRFVGFIKLKGSQSLSFTPMGENTDCAIISKWASPKFYGNYSPDSSNYDGKYYSANWSLSQLSRPMPSCWLSTNQPEFSDFNFGVEMIEPIDKYQQTYRAAKYSILFILLSFLTIFFFEFFSKQDSNILQYLLIGLSLVLFYSILLSLTEQMGFGWAYLVSAFAIIGLITIYFHSIFHKISYSLTMLLFWVILYSFLYLILQMEDYALIAGNIFLFIVLALIMYVSRKMNILSKSSNNSSKLEIDKEDSL